MELTNEFTVPVPVDDAWAVLTDVERIAPCMPGAELLGVEGEEYLGVVKVKVGPISAQYKGKAVFEEKDEPTHRAVIRAEGRETRGQGNATALITAVLTDNGGGTTVAVTTDLTISGKAAQFGRGVLADVSTKLLQQFASRLEADVLNAGAQPPAKDDRAESFEIAGETGPKGPAANGVARLGIPPLVWASGPGDRSPAPAAPVDLLGTVAGPIAKRAAPLIAACVVGLWLLRRRGRTHVSARRGQPAYEPSAPTANR